MKTSLLLVLPLAMLAVGAPGTARAQNPLPTASPAASPSQLLKFEESFVANLMQECVVEGKVADTARNRAAKSDVRELGASLGVDYPKLAEDLSLFAAKKSIALPTDLEASHQKDIDTLSGASGDDFDSAYLALTIDNQTRYLAQIKPMLSTTNDPDLKVVLEKTFARVSAHLAQARAVQMKYAGVNLDAKASIPK